MSTNTGIEWTEATWNPIAGCTPVSPGCLHCYAAKMAYRLEKMGQEKYAGLTVKRNGVRTFNGKINIDEAALTVPLRRKKPTTYFVNSMSDLFHESVPFEFVDKVFAVMSLCPQHTFQVLTKRPERMAEYTCDPELPNRIYQRVTRWLDHDDGDLLGSGDLWDRAHKLAEWRGDGEDIDHCKWSFPLPHVWLGCSPVNQKTADEYVGYLARTPAAVRFLSCEPLIDDMDLVTAYNRGAPRSWTDNETRIGVDWVIVGNESRGNGVGRLPGNSEAGFWEAARKLRDQCRAAGVAFFLKQAPVNGKTSGNPEDWPEDMRIREMPAQR